MKTDLDQYFMIDRSLIKRIIDYSDLKKDDIVLEIGPGKGFLTKEIVKKCQVIAVEKDEIFKKDLDKLARINKNLKIMFGNILKIMKKLKFNKVISNIPYSISEPLFKQLFRIQPELIVITVSHSFADKLLDENSKIGLQTSLFFDIEIKEKVPNKAFVPRPRTESSVVKLIPKEEESLSTLDIVLRSFILLNDKKTKNALMEALVKGLDLTKRKAKEIITNLDLSKKVLEKNSDLLSSSEFLMLKSSLTEVLSK